MVKVMWRKTAQNQRTRLMEYIRNEFGIHAALNAYNNIKHHEVLLSGHPHLGEVEQLLINKRLEYRSLVIHKYTKLVYYVNEKRGILFIAALWDTRREPSALVRGIHSK